MLTKRVHILFTKEDYRFLSTLANKKGSSVGKLIRQAVKKTYRLSQQMEERQKAIRSIISLWKKQKIKRAVDYKQLIEDGRRY